MLGISNQSSDPGLPAGLNNPSFIHTWRPEGQAKWREISKVGNFCPYQSVYLLRSNQSIRISVQSEIFSQYKIIIFEIDLILDLAFRSDYQIKCLMSNQCQICQFKCQFNVRSHICAIISGKGNITCNLRVFNISGSVDAKIIYFKQRKKYQIDMTVI